MNNKYGFIKKRVSQVIAASLAASLGTAAFANDFTIQGGQLTISSGAYSEALTVASDGRVSRPGTDVPASNNFGIPDFSFDLVNTAAVKTDGTYHFKVGVAIASDNNNRRIEAFLESLTLVVSNNGTTVTGSIPSQDLIVLARDSSPNLNISASAVLTNNATNGPISISGGSVKFSGERLVSRLKAANSAFDAILAAFDAGGHYTYRIVVQQTSGTPATRFGVGNTPTTFDPLPRVQTTCALNTESQLGSIFQLTSKVNDSDYRVNEQLSLAYAVQGQFSVVGASGSAANAPAAFTEICTTPVVESPDTGTTPPPAPDTPPPPPPETVNAASDAAAELADAVGGGFTEQTTTALSNAATAVENLANLVTGTVGQAPAALTEAQKETVKTATNSVLTASLTLINNPAATTENIVNLAADVNKMIENATKAGVAADETLVNQAVAVGQAATLSILREQSGLGADATPAQLAAAVVANPQLLENALSVATRIPAAVVRNQASVRESLPTQVAPEVANRLAASLASQLNLNNFTVGGQTLTSLLAGFLSAPVTAGQLALLNDERTATVMALASGDVSITTDAVSGTLFLSLPGESYAGSVTAVRSVSTALPNSILIRRNGTGVIVFNGTAIELAPVALDTVNFALAVENAGFQYGFRSGPGALRIALGGGERFAGVFAYDNLTGKDLDPASCGAITIVEPTIAPNLPGYAFGVNCANGVQQRVLPYIDADNFFASLEARNTNYAVDRNTGFVTITGTGVFKPSFFVSPATAAEQAYHDANKDSLGIALQAIDLNGDGKMDYKIIAPNGVQILYATN